MDCVLLTGTVTPRNTSFTARLDPDLRRRDYLNAFRYWASQSQRFNVVLCENSQTELTPFYDLLRELGLSNENIEILTFRGFTDPAKGKGRGELEIIEHALRNSRLIAKSDFAIKVTGRYTTPSHIHLSEQALRNQQRDLIICDFRHSLSYVDSRAFLSPPKFLRDYLLPLAEQVDDAAGVWFEHVLARAAHKWMSEGRAWQTPRARLVMHGITGSTGVEIGGLRKTIRDVMLHHGKQFILPR